MPGLTTMQENNRMYFASTLFSMYHSCSLFNKTEQQTLCTYTTEWVNVVLESIKVGVCPHLLALRPIHHQCNKETMINCACLVTDQLTNSTLCC